MRQYALFIGLLSGFLFGLATPLSKWLLGPINPFLLSGLLYYGAALINLKMAKPAVSAIAKLRHNPDLALKIIGVILFGGVLGPVFLLFGLKVARASSVAIWLNFELVATALFGVLFFKEQLDLPAWLGVAATILAGLVMTIGESGSGLLSGFLVILACSSWALDNHFTALIDGVDPEGVTLIKGVAAGTINTLIGIAISSGAPPLGFVLTALLIGMVSYGLSINCYVIAAQALGATRGQILFSTSPLWGVVVAVLFLQEPITWQMGAALVLLGIGVYLTHSLSHQHNHSHEPILHRHPHRHDDAHHGHDHDHGFVKSLLLHSHEHAHEALDHSHTHYPDLHHRHIHHKA